MIYFKKNTNIFLSALHLNETGIALFLVLWVLTLLSVIVGEFCHAMRTEVNITRNFKEETQAYYIAVAGLNTTIAELTKQRRNLPPIKHSDNENGDESAEETIEWRVNADIPEISFANGRFKITIGNESGKVNINKAEERLLRIMLSPFELDDTERDIIIDSILDWRDADHLHHVNGAEDGYYRSLPEPYECKDGDFDSVEELLLVRGITSEMFYDGGLRHMVTIYQEDEEKEEKNNSSQTAKISKKKKFSYNRININAASLQMLQALPMMTDELAQEIFEYRKGGGITFLGELLPILGGDIYRAVVPYVSLKTLPFFTITATGSIENSHTRQRVRALVRIDRKLRNKHEILRWEDRIFEDEK